MTQIAAQCYTIRTLTKDKDQTKDALTKLAKIGYKAVEGGSTMGGYSTPELKSLLGGLGITMIGTGCGLDQLKASPKKVADDAKSIGATSVMFSGSRESFETVDGIKALAAVLAPAAKALASEGITFLYHNHDHEFTTHGGKSGHRILSEEAPNIQFEVDVHWVARGGGEPTAVLKALKGRVGMVHAKDLSYVPGKGAWFRAVGEGNLNWPGIIEAGKASGAKAFIVEQDDCLDRNPLDCLEVSYKNLRSWGLS